jgi:4-aminobutyrate aminotransferase-like enzyme
MVPRDTTSDDSVLARRNRYLAPSQKVYYDAPMNLVASRDVWLIDSEGREYLDCMNNVTSVGHAHPAVTAAATLQMGRLNTNARLLYSGIADLAERLVATMPEGLDTVYFTCTGSESNDLALRIARTVTGRSDVLVLDGAYHGNTTAVTDISPNRFNGPGGTGAPATTHVLPVADLFHGPHHGADATELYGRDLATAFSALDEQSVAPAALFAESLMGTGGIIPHPASYLAQLYDAARQRGALCVADEVQVGLGRTGENFWTFDTKGVRPDIVTIGKPLGNGHPVAAVITTREIAERFDTGMRYFNTFGGNPVSCAIALSVLDVIEREGLQENCRVVGSYLHEGLANLQGSYPVIGDVRGEGLYLGVELVAPEGMTLSSGALALRVTERLREEGIATFPTGNLNNVLKIKPPMTFAKHHADLLVQKLALVCGEFH